MYGAATTSALVIPSRIMDIGSRHFDYDDNKNGLLTPPSSMALLSHVHQPQAFVIPPLANVRFSIFLNFSILSFF